MALPGADKGERNPCFGLDLLVAEPPGQGEHLLGGPFCLLITAPERQGPAELAEDLGAHPVRVAGKAQRRPHIVNRSGEQALLAEHGPPQQQ